MSVESIMQYTIYRNIITFATCEEIMTNTGCHSTIKNAMMSNVFDNG